MAIYLVGNFFFEFTSEYQKDLISFGVKDKTKFKPPLVPWKVHSERLLQGMENLKEITKDTPANKNAVLLQTRAKPLLEKMKLYDRIETQGLKPDMDRLRRIIPPCSNLSRGRSSHYRESGEPGNRESGVRLPILDACS